MRIAVISAGDVFGRLTAVRASGSSVTGHSLWAFRCECGNTKIARSCHIFEGRVMSCGCLRIERVKSANRERTGINSGDRFHRLVAVSEHHVDDGRIYWQWTCDCGQSPILDAHRVKTGHTKSCGCFNREAARKRLLTHGKTGTKEYRAWAGMKRRCYCISSSSYPDYGGRGITVCDRWRTSFDDFLADVGIAPSHKHSLDRTDNSKGYEPGNCQWRTFTDQMNNRRGNILVTYEGRTLTLTAWSRELGIKRGTLASRIRSGWTIHRSFTTPTQFQDRVSKTINGDSFTVE